MEDSKLIPHLFRTEYSKIVAVLCKHFGLSNIELAEDITSEAFLVASETWSFKGVPENPKAWLYTVAKNKTKDYFKRNKLFQEKITPNLNSSSEENIFEINLSEKNINDSQLQMIFAVCNPIISAEAQISLALRVLCGFGIDEIAQAFLAKKETINKRLLRAKKTLKEQNVSFDFPKKTELDNRLENVLSVIYLLFNEGYYSQSSVNQIRKDLCIEAMRLCYMLLDYEPTNMPQTNALMAILCFHSSRFEARTDAEGEVVLYKDQNKEVWNKDLIKKGKTYLNQSAGGPVTKYHLEAMISFWHTEKVYNPDKWENILQLYNRLLQLEYSPVIALNRTYALFRANGAKKALNEIKKIELKDHHLYHSLIAEFYKEIDQDKQIEHLLIALKLVKNDSDKKLIQRKLDKLL